MKQVTAFTAYIPAAMQALNQLVTNNVEQVVTLQTANLRGYTALGLDQLKAAAEVTTPVELQTYLAQQPQALKTTGQRLLADTQALVQLQQTFAQNVSQLAQTWVPAKTPLAP